MVLCPVCRSIFIEVIVQHPLIVAIRCYIWKVTGTRIWSSLLERVLGQDDNKCQDRDERPAAPGRLIVKDKSRKGEGRLFAPAGLKKRCTRGASENSFFACSPPFFSVISIREDVPATLATLPAGGCHRHRER